MQEESSISSSRLAEPISSQQSSQPDKIYVDLKGAVKHPGVYALDQGSRVFDLLEMAGGLTEDAAERALNQAQLLVDQQSLYVPTMEEWEAESQGPQANLVGSQDPLVSSPNSGKVNINQADLAQLETLPGIGAKKAQAIIDYRTANGSFHSLEDLGKVKGIGPKMLEKLKDLVIFQ
ncbi:ComEA family DNA-binding protein [Abiotrophia sp.]|uniref:ComEA family DNA-binding protein n=1 Tax=Abiotrophia sp. TaxID=76631 RepID=UPI001CB60B65|nr:ComEA family DNA-binding protein [Abiotrophia sp.]MBF0937073.1 ComEA family DNA-binding protein [Abiotrophia sp.]